MEINAGKKENWVSVGYCLLIAALTLVILIMATVPPVSRDALTHHLAVPKLWLRNGGIYEIPSVPFSYYPMNLDLLYAIPLYFGNDIAPKYIHFSFALLTASLIFFYLRSRLKTSYGLLGALFFLSIPVIVKLSVTVYVDLGLIFFSTAALLSLLEWKKHGYKWKYLIFSAVSCGLALGTKYNGMVVFFLLTCSVPFIYLRRTDNDASNKSLANQFRALGYGAVFFLVSLLLFSPWLVKNAIQTNNPVFPLYNRWFQSFQHQPGEKNRQPDVTLDKKVPRSGKWGHFAIRKVIYGESFGQIALIPLRVFFEGQDDDPKYFDGRLNPFLLIFPMLLLVPWLNKSGSHLAEIKILSIFSFAYLIFVFFRVDMRIRWISPIVPPMVILSMFGLQRLHLFGSRSGQKWNRWFIKGALLSAIAGMLLINANYLYGLYQKIDPISYISGRVGRDQYITRFRPEYEIVKHINQKLPDDALVLCLFIGNRIYYYDRPIRSDKNVLKRAVRSSASIDQIGDSLENMGITHILMRYDLSESWIENEFDVQEQALLKLFLEKHAKPVKNYGGYGFFELISNT